MVQTGGTSRESGEEKRKCPRFPYAVKAEYRDLGIKTGTAGDVIPARTIDASKSGFGLVAGRAPEVGRLIELGVIMPGDSKEMHMRAIVQWVREDPYTEGQVRFGVRLYDKFKPWTIVLIGLVVAVVMTFLVCLIGKALT